MIDLDVAEFHIGVIETVGGKSVTVGCAMMRELITRLRQAEKDATRYRWLRDSASTEEHGGFAYDFRLVDAIRYMPGAAPNETMDIDEAIDEAMQCSK